MIMRPKPSVWRSPILLLSLSLRLENPLCESYGLTAERRRARSSSSGPAKNLSLSLSKQGKEKSSVAGALTLSEHL